MLKIVSALPVQFGPANVKKAMFHQGIVVASLPDYVPDECDVRLPPLPKKAGMGSSAFASLGKLREKWEPQGLVCIVKVNRYGAAEAGKPMVVTEEFMVARFTKINAAIMFKFSVY